MFKHFLVIIGFLCFSTLANAEVQVANGGSVSLKSSDGIIIEDVVPSIVTTEIDHWMTHMGASYTVSDTLSIAAGATYGFLVKNTVDTGTHMTRFEFHSTEGDASIAFYEGSAIGSNGSEVTPRNNNRNYSDSANVQVFINTSTTALGTQLEHDIITGGKQSGGSGGDVEEWVFKQYTAYTFSYTNNSGQADVISYHFDFLEVGLLP